MSREIKTILGLLVGSLGLMVFGPFTVHEHYVFGVMALLLVILLYAPRIMQIGLSLILSVLWLPNVMTGTYIRPAQVATVDRLACIKTVCDSFPQPIYVVTNSGSHDHQGLGYAYLAQQIGCNMFAVTQWKTQQPKIMVVMNENTAFDSGGTDFYELNRFGKRRFENQLTCGPNLTVTVFTRLNE